MPNPRSAVAIRGALLTTMVAIGVAACREQVMEVPSSIAQIGVFGVASDYPGLSITVSATDLSRTFDLTDLFPHSQGFQSVNFLVPDAGQMTVDVVLRDGATIVAGGDHTVTLRQSFQWGIRVLRQELDPHEGSLCRNPAVEIPIAVPYQRNPEERIWLSITGPFDGSAC